MRAPNAQPEHKAARETILLGVETSCDETSVSLVKSSGMAGSGIILSNVVLSQIDQHAPYGGVVPEIAAREHLSHIDHVVRTALLEAGVALKDVDAIAATAGPGLIGGVMIGFTAAKAMALSVNRPLIPINHLEAHALTCRLRDDVGFPYLLLLVSGGHCQLIEVQGLGQHKTYGQTLDDAVGEAFDKAAKFLGLGYPGGPVIETRASMALDRRGHEGARTAEPRNHADREIEARYRLPRPLKGADNCDFSFSGLKTALQHLAVSMAPLSADVVDDICLSFQTAVLDCLLDRSARAMEIFTQANPEAKDFVIAGGVAANQALRGAMRDLANQHGLQLTVAAPELCTDNGAMVAWAGAEYYSAGKYLPLSEALKLGARARWPLAEMTTSPIAR